MEPEHITEQTQNTDGIQPTNTEQPRSLSMSSGGSSYTEQPRSLSTSSLGYSSFEVSDYNQPSSEFWNFGRSMFTMACLGGLTATGVIAASSVLSLNVVIPVATCGICVCGCSCYAGNDGICSTLDDLANTCLNVNIRRDRTSRDINDRIDSVSTISATSLPNYQDLSHDEYHKGVEILLNSGMDQEFIDSSILKDVIKLNKGISKECNEDKFVKDYKNKAKESEFFPPQYQSL